MSKSSLEKYIQNRESEAEDENYHNIIRQYQRIANALLEVLSEDATLKIMKKIGSLIQ